jgi:hypothetical protein
MRQGTLCIGFLLGVLALSTSSGCGGDPRNRQAVTGAVTLKGQPLNDGIVTFAPVEGQETGDGAQITNGKYRIPKKKGLSPGKYKVTIIAGDGRSGTGNASPDSPYAGMRPGKERIPPQYNAKSKIFKEVTEGGPNQFDFAIP